MAVMNPAPAVALLRDGTRVVLSDPLDEARRHWRDGEYDTDVVAIEQEGPAPAMPAYQIPQTFHQEQLPL